MATILKLVGLLPKVVDLAKRAYDRYQKSQRIQKENKRRKQIKEAVKNEDAEKMRQTMAEMVSDIRRNVSD